MEFNIDNYVHKLKTEYPAIFKSLPLPEDLREKWGVPPASQEVVSINTFMSDFLKLQNNHCDEQETKKTCVVEKPKLGQHERDSDDEHIALHD